MYSQRNLSQRYFAHHTSHNRLVSSNCRHSEPSFAKFSSVQSSPLPLCKRPVSIKRASTNSFGSSRQNDVTKCKNGAVGPPCCHSDRSTPARPSTTLLAGSAAQVLRCRPNLNPSFARLPILNKAAARKKGIRSIATPFSARYACSSRCGGRVDPGHVRAA